MKAQKVALILAIVVVLLSLIGLIVGLVIPLPLTLIALLIIAILLGRALASGLRDDQRKIVGGVGLLAGVILLVYGISSVNSTGSQIMGSMGRPDVGGIAAIGFGILALKLALS